MMILSTSEIRAICLSKFSARKCPACDNDGLQYWDGATGFGVGPNPPINVAAEDIAKDACENCDGVGYLLQIVEVGNF